MECAARSSYLVRRLLQAPAAQRSLGGGMFNTEVAAAPAQGITDASLFIRGQHDKRNGAGLNRPQFGDAQPPFTQQFQQHCVERLVYLVQFVNQQDTGFIPLQGTQKRTGAAELLAVQLGSN
jgi:hypothetical protein